MGKTYSTFQGTKVSGAVRRIGNLAGRSRSEWKDAKRFSNHAFAGERARAAALPRFVKRTHDADLRAIALQDAIDDAIAYVREHGVPTEDHAVTLPVRSVIGRR